MRGVRAGSRGQGSCCDGLVCYYGQANWSLGRCYYADRIHDLNTGGDETVSGSDNAGVIGTGSGTETGAGSEAGTNNNGAPSDGSSGSNSVNTGSVAGGHSGETGGNAKPVENGNPNNDGWGNDNEGWGDDDTKPE